MTCQIAISIINYRTGPMTIECVRSVLADIGDLEAQVIVVDNASNDGSADQIANWIAGQPAGAPVKLVRSLENTGFSGGHNQAMAAVQADHYLFLNSDALLRPGFLTHILTAADANPKAGLIAPQIETDNGDVQISCFRFHSPFSELIRGAASGPITHLLQRHDVALQSPVVPAQIEWVSFACILLRETMVQEIGPMDEGYFLYFEDAAYCMQARRAGWRIVQEPRAVVVHYKGGSGPVEALSAARKSLPAYYYSARTRFFYQTYGHAGLLLANLMWLSGRGLAQLRRFVGKSVPKSMDSETRDLWINFLRPLGPRHAPED